MAKVVPELYCTNIKKSVNFYCNILGFSLKYDRPEHGFAYLQREGAEIMLEELGHTERKWITAELTHPYGRGVNFQIEVKNAENLLQKINDADVNLFMPLEEKWYRQKANHCGNKQFIVQDPDGYLLRFYEDLGCKPS